MNSLLTAAVGYKRQAELCAVLSEAAHHLLVTDENHM
jgi:hypothetical protein